MVNLLKLNGYVGRVSEAPPGNMLATETMAGQFRLPWERARGRGSNAVWSFMLSVASAHIALPVNFLRYVS
ncbi:hypothetical protein ACN1DD_002761, partial [Klebsiella quasipneumoniae]